MRINKISINDFRGMDSLNIGLNGSSAIFFGINGVGKSTILRAVDLLFANLIWKITKSSKKLADLQESDIRVHRVEASIKVQVEFEDGSVDEYSRSISRERGRKHSAKSLDELAEKFAEKYLSVPYSDEDGNWIEPQDIVNMPIFVNYGVNRLADKVEPKGEKKVYGKLNAFDKAIENRLDFDQLFTWLRNREDLENQIKVSMQSDFYDKGLECVKKAMFAMLDGFSKSIRIERKTMTLEIEKNGSVMDFNCLSDGEKCTMALFGDIARRLVIANPSLDNPLEGTGVVSIDEIDLHMHSSWQRKILGCLREIFPNLQFLITTHSVQVLGEAGDDYKQFLVERGADGIVVCRQLQTSYGLDCNTVSEDVFGVPSVSYRIKNMVDEMYDSLDREDLSRAAELADEIDRATKGRNVDVVRARNIIDRRKRRNEANK